MKRLDLGVCTSRSDSTLSTRRRSKQLLVAIAALSSTAIFHGSRAVAANLSWDGDGQLPLSGGNGLWDTVSPRWWNGTTFIPWSDAANNDATFGGNPGFVLAPAAHTVNSLTFDANYLIAGTGTGAGIGTLTLGATGPINTGANRVEIFTPFAGSTGLTKSGSGLLVVHGASTGFTGAWNINAGTVALGNATLASIPDSAAVTIAAGATLDMGIYGAALNDTFGSLAGAGTLRLQSQDPILGSTGSAVTAGGNNTNTTWTGTISGPGGRFTKSGTGTLTINGSQTYTGLTQITGGQLASQSGALVLDIGGALSSQSPVFFGTGTLNAATLLVNADKTLGSLSNGGTLSIVNMQLSKLTIGSDNLSTQFSGVIAGSGRLTKSGTGLQGLAGTANSTWTGGTTVQSGTLAVNGDARLGQAPASPTSNNIALDGGVLANTFATALPLSTNRGIQVTSNNGGLAVHGSTATMTTAAAITGVGRITKTGAGTLALGGGATAVASANTFAGGMDIQDGSVAVTFTSGSPIGNGPVSLANANLSTLPAASASNVTLNYGNLNYGPGANLIVGRNTNTSLTANFGTIARDAGGTMVLYPVDGLAELGGAGANFSHVTGAGVTNNANGGVPAVNGDIASPSILAASSLADQTGEFVRYGANGFEKGIYSIATDLNLATTADVFDATSNQNILVSANPFALIVRANRAITGGALTIGSGSQPATVILNNGTISTTALDFGAREAIVFAGTTGQSLISAPITGSAGLTKLGSANLALSSALNVAGGVRVAAGTLSTLAGSNNILGATTDLTLAGAGPTGATTAPRLNLNGTTQTIRSLAGSQSATVDLGAGGTLVVSGTVDSQYRGAITGTFSGGGTVPSTLVKDGAGILTLGEQLSSAAVPSTVNSFQRLIVRNGGVVAVSSPNSLPQSFNASLVAVPADEITLDAGTLRIQSITNTLLNTAGGSTFAIASGAATQRGITVNTGGGTFEVTNPAETALAQIDNATSFDIVHGPATAVIHKTGQGALRLGPGNSFQGKWDVREGNLQFSADSALGDTTLVGFRSDALAVANGAMIQSLGATVLAGTRGITLTGGSGTLANSTSGAYFNGTFTIGAAITGAGGIVKVGAGPLTLSNGSNNFAGDLRIQSGTVTLATNSAGAGSIVVQALSSSGLSANANVTIPNAIQLADAAEIDIAAQTGATFTLNGAIGGPGSFFKFGDGTLVLNNSASNFTGTARLMRGVTMIGPDNALGSAAGATIVAPGAILGFNSSVNYTAAEPVYIAGDGNGAGGAIKNFLGTTSFAGDVTLMADATIGVPGGSLAVGNIQGNSTVTKVGFGTLTAARVRAAGLTLLDGTTRITAKGASASPAGTSVVNALSLFGDDVPDVQLDITDNAFVVDYTGGSPFATIRNQIISGYNGGGANAWIGQGIISSLAQLDPQHVAVGYAEASAVFTSFPATFAGVQVDNTSVLFRHTRSGDANLDGIVNLADFNRLASNFGQTGRVWSQADFNYDGIVNLADFNLLASNFGLTAGADGVVDPSDWAALASAVPEPSLLLLTGVPALTGMGMRRRRRAT